MGFAYETPLDLPEGCTVDDKVIYINNMPWQQRSDCNYKHRYYEFFDRCVASRGMTAEEKAADPGENELNLYRVLIKKDLWFFVYFVMKNPLANHPFIVEACKEVEGEESDSLQVWARDHLKSTIITVGRACQKILSNPEVRVGIFSATRPLALAFQKLIRDLLESAFIKACFPDVVYEDPYKESPKWSEAVEGGLIVKRLGFYKEPTVSSWGLTEGMPVGFHLTDMFYDDIVTQDLVTTPEMMRRVKDNFDISENLRTRDGQATVVGTFYHHDDPLVYIRDKVDPITNKPLFVFRKKPATIDGSMNGASVFLPEATLAKRRANNLYFFKTQQLLDPTAKGTEKLSSSHLTKVARADAPKDLYKFMLIDSAGDKGRRQDGRSADAWAIGVIGVEPYSDDTGASDIYILDAVIEPMDLVTACNTVVDMYLRSGRILKVGIEKVGVSTAEVHVANALRMKKKYISVENKSLEILRPGGRSKEYRIEGALSWPLRNGKIKYLDSVPVAYIERLKMEMDKFPYWHDDGLDMLSYIYDMIKNYKFGKRPGAGVPEDAWARSERKWKEQNNKVNGWISV